MTKERYTSRSCSYYSWPRNDQCARNMYQYTWLKWLIFSRALLESWNLYLLFALLNFCRHSSFILLSYTWIGKFNLKLCISFWHSSFLAGYGGKSLGNVDPKIAEAIAFREALSWLKKLQVPQIFILSSTLKSYRLFIAAQKTPLILVWSLRIVVLLERTWGPTRFIL